MPIFFAMQGKCLFSEISRPAAVSAKKVFSQGTVYARTCTCIMRQKHILIVCPSHKCLFYLSNFDNKFQKQQLPHEKTLIEIC